MPTYRAISNIDSIDGVFVKAGTDVNLPDGPRRDELLRAGAIYRPDVPPGQPRLNVLGGRQLVPARCRWLRNGQPVERNLVPAPWWVEYVDESGVRWRRLSEAVELEQVTHPWQGSYVDGTGLTWWKVWKWIPWSSSEKSPYETLPIP